MARTRRLHTRRTKETKTRLPLWKRMLAVTCHLFSEAEDEVDELNAQAMLALTIKTKQNQPRHGRWGRRGPYNAPQVEEFFKLLLEGFSEKRFRIWMRCCEAGNNQTVDGGQDLPWLYWDWRWISSQACSLASEKSMVILVSEKVLCTTSLTGQDVLPMLPYSSSPGYGNIVKNIVRTQSSSWWTKRLSAICIKIEHTFGLLKGQFQYLRLIPGHNLQRVNRTIEALFVSHNILTSIGDDPMKIVGLQEGEAPRVARHISRLHQREVAEETDSDLYRSGLFRHKHLLGLMKRR
ncbi:hypothetical protein PUNSTDRAFT_42631 [Punctularia strigosozonata HHB-11173 SS5]|uniref:uncharacterized protein n=1 Tax=Punctularia strigosozonata (strain HHB-11173) TaxID=741275 RepID=UPI00044178CE|nr:uncharacterized protein PUNSTDRAFT_42631 [Punctularia strigosozonata HHB-11173 SS5]EIN11338.1 hypothetical protein PUNSTDRAFT_42631 [Punctularia strigosozonata HHB-11173 SS5]